MDLTVIAKRLIRLTRVNPSRLGSQMNPLTS